MSKLDELNFIESREKRIAERRRSNPASIEKATDKDCKWSFRGDGYLCGQEWGGIIRGENAFYQGRVSFDFRFEPKKLGMSKIPSRDEAFNILDCAREKLEILPEFNECKLIMTSDPKIVRRKHSEQLLKEVPSVSKYYQKVVADADLSYLEQCKDADDLRDSATPHNNAEKFKILLENLKLDAMKLERKISEKVTDPEREKVIKERISKLKKTIAKTKKMLEDGKYFDDRWNAVRGKSIDRGFFFNGVAASLDWDDRVTSLNVHGSILSPIHDFLEEEMTQLKQAASEAIYSCTPPELRTRKRMLEYF